MGAESADVTGFKDTGSRTCTVPAVVLVIGVLDLGLGIFNSDFGYTFRHTTRVSVQCRVRKLTEMAFFDSFPDEVLARDLRLAPEILKRPLR